MQVQVGLKSRFCRSQSANPYLNSLLLLKRFATWRKVHQQIHTNIRNFINRDLID